MSVFLSNGCPMVYIDVCFRRIFLCYYDESFYGCDVQSYTDEYGNRVNRFRHTLPGTGQ